MQSSILIADDHPLILKGLYDFLIEKGYNIIASAQNGNDAYELIKEKKPEIAILDIQMPYMTGLEIAKKCQEEELQSKIVLITFETDETLYNKAKELNIYGYVLKEFTLDEIENCISSVENDLPYFSPYLMQSLEVNEPPEALALLSNTEKEVLKFIAQNKTAKEIGELMFISSRTVEKHKSHIINKLQLESKASSLFLFAKENESYLDKIT